MVVTWDKHASTTAKEQSSILERLISQRKRRSHIRQKIHTHREITDQGTVLRGEKKQGEEREMVGCREGIIPTLRLWRYATPSRAGRIILLHGPSPMPPTPPLEAVLSAYSDRKSNRSPP
jgi:hypothetical protein